MAANKGSKHHNSKLTPATVRAARKAIEKGGEIVVGGKRVKTTVAALARKYGVTHQTMRSAIKGETWGHVQ